MVFAYVHYKHHLGFKPERLSLVLTTDAILDSNQNGLRLYLLQTPFWIQTKMVFACAHTKRHLGFNPHWRSLVLTSDAILDSNQNGVRRHFGFILPSVFTIAAILNWNQCCLCPRVPPPNRQPVFLRRLLFPIMHVLLLELNRGVILGIINNLHIHQADRKELDPEEKVRFLLYT